MVDQRRQSAGGVDSQYKYRGDQRYADRFRHLEFYGKGPRQRFASVYGQPGFIDCCDAGSDGSNNLAAGRDRGSSLFSDFGWLSGGTSPYTWSVVSGNLSIGLTLNTNIGLISGDTHDGRNLEFHRASSRQRHASGHRQPGPLIAVANGAGSAPLPTLSVDLPSYAGLTDTLSIGNYGASNVSFVWTFNPTGTSSFAAPQNVKGVFAGTKSFSSPAQTQTLASYGLTAGAYQVELFLPRTTAIPVMSRTRCRPKSPY